MCGISTFIVLPNLKPRFKVSTPPSIKPVHYQETNKSHQIPRIDYEKQFISSPSLHETMIMLPFSIIGLNQAHQHIITSQTLSPMTTKKNS
jgi:hypothetical protein